MCLVFVISIQMFNVLANLKITDGVDTSSSTATDTSRTVAPERPPPPRTKEQQQENDKEGEQQQPSWGTSVAGVSPVCMCFIH